MIINEDDYIEHYGVLRRSGRYPWGSGVDQETHISALLNHVAELKKKGLSEKEIAEGLALSVGQLRAEKTIAKAQQKQAQISMAQKLKDKGLSNGAIAERMGLAGESSVRALLAPGAADKAAALTSTADMLKSQVDEKQFLDIGKGVEHHVGVSKERLNAAVAMLKEQGYEVHRVKQPQIGTGFDTDMKVLCPPGTTWADVRRNQNNIKQIQEFSDDGGRTFAKVHPPLSIDPKRVGVVYKEDGGDLADGVIYVREGKSDLSIGNNRYGQVRIKVGDDHYLKGMAIYKKDMPDGVDLLFNTNKSKADSPNKLDVMKKISDDPDYPFGSVVRQIVKNPGTPDERVTSVMNLVGTKEGSGEAGSWGTWSRNLSSQFLSKQSPTLAKTQLDVTYERRKNEFDDIMALTNPTVRKKLLEEFARNTDSAAVHLKAAALPRQSTHVILPVNSLKPNEVYAPNFKNGERVVLVRYPHGGTFEIPELVVNKRNREAQGLLGDAIDAIGIHHSVAQRLSGADFDGDTVIVIPNNSNRVKTSPALDQLRSFDPRASYPAYDGMKPMSARTKGIEMGNVSNLITDMTIAGASHADIARAVKHSMVVIDAEKHNLDYRRSAIENGIPALKAQYQGSSRAGAATLISRKGQTEYVPERKPRPMSEGGPVDRETGRRVFVETGRTRVTPTGERIPKRERVNKLDATDDAHSLSSGTRMETIYANHSNRLKDLANQARLASVNTPRLNYSPSANRTYRREVQSLTSKLALSERNAPLERQAQILADAAVRARRRMNPNLEADTIAKIRYQELEKARLRTGASRQAIQINQDEWNAIQAGAISNNRLDRILNNADIDSVRSFATPRVTQLMTPNKQQRARDMSALGYTRAEVAEALGVSVSTLDKALGE